MRDIEATAVVSAPPVDVFSFLSELGNHWRVADRFVEVVSHHGAGGVVRVRGPLGIHRTARIRVERVDPPARLIGSARIGARTEARVSWMLEGQDDVTLVRLVAEIASASRFDRLLLALGGRAWLDRRFGSALAQLAGCFAPDQALAPAGQDAQRTLGLGTVPGEVRGG